MGIPVIITDVGGIGDIVTNGFNGFLLERAEASLVKGALMKYLECPQLLDTHAKNGYEKICRENALPVHAKKIAEVVENS